MDVSPVGAQQGTTTCNSVVVALSCYLSRWVSAANHRQFLRRCDLPRCSMYGIFALHWPKNKQKCREIFHTWSIRHAEPEPPLLWVHSGTWVVPHWMPKSPVAPVTGHRETEGARPPCSIAVDSIPKDMQLGMSPLIMQCNDVTFLGQLFLAVVFRRC